MKKFLNNFNRLIGIDLGTSQTRIWSDKEGLVLDEPSCLAVDILTKKVLAVGKEALEMKGRVDKKIGVYFPMQKGQIYDLDLARAMLRVFLQKILKSTYFFNPNMMVSVPALVSKNAERLTADLFYSLGANQVFTIREPLVAAIGAGVPISDASACFILQMGAGIVEGAIISLGSLIDYQSSFQAGNFLDQRIIYAVRKNKQLLISQEAAEKLKVKIASISAIDKKEVLVMGKDIAQSSPKELSINSGDLMPAFEKILLVYINLLKTLLSKAPPELIVDVINKGMLLSGGLAKLDGLEEHLVATLGVPVSVIDNPKLAVINGIATVLENLDEFKESLGYQQ
ncbi:MAG: rod shape-determining protein [Candidatus Woesebacteria bacterium]|jgi:rod shape-determining protein MreB